MQHLDLGRARGHTGAFWRRRTTDDAMGGDDDDPRAGELEGVHVWARGCLSRALPTRDGLRLPRHMRLRPLPRRGLPSLDPGNALPAQLSPAPGAQPGREGATFEVNPRRSARWRRGGDGEAAVEGRDASSTGPRQAGETGVGHLPIGRAPNRSISRWVRSSSHCSCRSCRVTPDSA